MGITRVTSTGPTARECRAASKRRGRWCVEPTANSFQVVEVGAGNAGDVGLVCTCERMDDAVWIARQWNLREGA